MEYRLFNDTYVVRLERGEELTESLTELCRREKIDLGSIEGLGASDHTVLGLYDVTDRVYHKRSFDEPMEITSILGNISAKDGEVYLHIHINLGRADGSVVGGHLNECRISATCELFVRRLPGRVERELDEAVTGLNLYKFL